MKKIIIINGPNLNLLSLRNQDIYGDCSLTDIENKCRKIAKDNNCKVLVGHQRRFYPLVSETKKIISDKKIGKVIGLSGVWSLRKDKDYFEPEWRKKVSAGPIITNLIHDIDYLRFIFGEIHSVSSFSSNMINNFEKEDVVSANIQFKNGIIGNFLITDA